MPEFPSCFGEYGIQVSESVNGGRGTQNVVTCFYKAKLAEAPCVITVNWCKTLGGQGLSVSIDDSSSESSCKVDMKPWLFWKKKGSKILDVGERKVEVHWDLSSAKYGSSPEPVEGFYLAVICGCEVVLLLGNMLEGAHKRALSLSPLHHRLKPTLISRTEHIVGKRFYSTKAQFRENGSPHDIVIECQIAGKDPRFSLRIDRQLMLQVKRLMWKFRGNYTIMVDGLPVELLWDVHNWLFNQSDNHAVFMFQVGARSPVVGKQDCASSASCIQWHQHNIAKKSPHQGEEVSGFSLLLYAWNSE